MSLEKLSQAAPISTWALLGAGMVLSALNVFMVLIIWLGGWSKGREQEQLQYIGIMAIMLSLDIAVVIVSLARARLSAKGLAGTGFEIGAGASDPPAPSGVKVTAELTK